MPRAKAPVVGVISYFQTAPLEQAQLTLAIVKHVVAAREEGLAAAAPVKRAKPAVPRKERADKGKSRKAKEEEEGDSLAFSSSSKVGSFAV